MSLSLTASGSRAYRVVGVDPGLAHLGLGAVEEERRAARLLGSSLLTTSSRSSAPERLGALRDGVMAFLERHRPDALVIESQFFHRQKGTAFKVGQAFGVVMLCAADLGVPVHEYGPLEVKLALVGTGRADKGQVAFMVRALLELPRQPASDHEADALALALTHLQSRRLAAAARGHA
ncbi:MAG TPA: crossover junction endodeoxyribonuclease RuvC [Trueperaceae bacterium]|nr:crossover junction endodeoxyribonuclease RuvC [Trueperaceae bacterium]